MTEHRSAPVFRLIATALIALGTTFVVLAARHRTRSIAWIDELRPLAALSPATSGPRYSIDAPRPTRGTWGARDAERLVDVAARAGAAARQRGDASALHAAALIDLRWHDTTHAATAIARAIPQLETARRLGDPDAALLSDLAAAHLARHALLGDGRPLFEATEAAAWAVERAPDFAPAHFNLTLALHRLGLATEAARSGRAYLALDSTSAWAERVRAIVRADAVPARPSPPSPGADPATLAAFVASDHESARRVGWDGGLARWGTLTMRGDVTGAREALRFALSLGALLHAAGGDATLIDAARWVETHREPRTAAVAFRAYDDGQRAYAVGDYEHAEASYARVLAIAEVPPPLTQWARVFRGSSLVHSGRALDGERLMRLVIATDDSVRHVALVGRAHGSLGTSLGRRGLATDAHVAIATAQRLLARAGETESAAGMQSMLMELAFLGGDGPTGYGIAREILDTLRTHRHTVWRHNVLYIAAAEAATDGFRRTAARMQDESVDAAAGTGRPIDLAEALLARARLSVLTGHRVGLDDDVRAARALLDAAPAGSGRAYTEADFALSEGLSLVTTRPTDAVRRLDTAVAFFDRISSVLRVVPALAVRAEAHAAAGNVDAALADLGRAESLLDARAARMGSTPERAMFYREGRRVLERVLMLRVAHGQSHEALDDIERTRWMISWGGGASDAVAAPTTRPLVGETGVTYARVADTLLTWTTTDGAVRLVRTTIDGARLDRVIERARTTLEMRAPDALVREPLTELYELLVRPIAGSLGTSGRPLVVVADGELAAVPFAALYDARRGRYLLEDHPVRFATTLRDAATRSPSRDASPPHVVLVADPAFDARQHPELDRLPGAAVEAAAVGALYPRATVLGGPSASREQMERALRGATVLHYAGHAVSDDERPERSYLVLAGDDGGGSAQLRAEAIARLPLGGVRLVVLSACQTITAQHDALRGLAGIADAFRAAGVRGVVGSPWRVDDALTRPLMESFHHRYARTGDGPGSLRAAQLELLHSSTPAWRSPAAWGAFRYIGR